MAKRRAEYQLDRENFNQQAISTTIDDSQLANANDRICTPEEIMQRKIYRAKRLTRPGDTNGNRSESRGRFRIICSLNPPPDPVRPVDYTVRRVIEQPSRTEENKKISNDEKSNRFEAKTQSNISATKKVEQKPAPSKPTESAPQVIRSDSNPKMLFGKKIGESSSSSVFANKPSESEKKNTVSIFGKSLQSSTSTTQANSIFCEKSEQKLESKSEIKPVPEESKAPSIDKQQEPEKVKVAVVPEKTTDKPSLFGAKTTSTTSGLFGKKQEQSTVSSGLFGKKDEQPALTLVSNFAKKSDEITSQPTIFAKKVENPAPVSENILANKKKDPFTTPVNKVPENSSSSSSILEKKEKSQTPVQTGLFGNKIKPSDDKIGGLFAKKSEALTPDPNTTKQGLLGTENKGVSIFGKKSDETPDKNDKPQETKKFGLFSDPPKPSTGLFGKPKIQDKNDDKVKEPEKKFTSLFGSQNKEDAASNSEKSSSSSLFGASKQGPLFGGTKTLFATQSLFSGVPKFTKTEDQKHSFISSGSKNEEGEGEGDNENVEKEDDKPKFVSVSKDPYIKIFNKNVEKIQN